MTQTRYEKDISKQHKTSNYFVIEEEKKDPNVGDIIESVWTETKNLASINKIANIVVPGAFILLGIALIYQQLFPDIQGIIQENSGVLSQGTLSPVSEEYVNKRQYISSPTGLAELTQKALEEDILSIDSTSKFYKGKFEISIPSLGINRLPVTANVDSTKEESYMSVLDSTLAHFENTGLPISEVQNNIVIYGHSASLNYSPTPSDPMVAFSFLPELKVGDDIILHMEGKEYKFKMQRSKIVEPTDTSIITGTKGRRTLTLFTCFPLGNNAKRYVAIARPV